MIENQPVTHFKIAVSGDLGSGKSTVCNLLREKLSSKIFSMGEAWRKLAEKYRMTILELNKYSETHPLDEEMDSAMAEMGKAPENIIFDSRLAWHFVPDSFKAHLIVDLDIAAARVFKDIRGSAEGYGSLEEARAKIAERKISECQRYFQKYGIDCANLDNYNLVIDTSYATPENITGLITDQLRVWSEGKPCHKFWLAPLNLIPTSKVQGLGPVEEEKLGKKEQEIVAVIKSGHQWYIEDGHQWVSRAIFSKKELLPVEMIRDAGTEFGEKIDRRLIEEWKEFHGV